MQAKLFLLVLLSGWGIVAPAQVIINGNFETNTAPGNVFNITNAVFGTYMSNTTGFGGANAMDIQNNASTWGPAQSGNWFVSLEYLLSGDAFTMRLSAPLTAGTTYYLCYWDKGMDVAGCCNPPAPLQIGLATAAGTQGTVVYTSPAPTLGVWTQRIFSFVAPNNGQFISVSMSAWRWTCVDNFVLSASSSCTPLLATLNGDFQVTQPDFNTNLLRWETIEETGLLNFSVERSADGTDFQTIGYEVPRGSGAYEFPDRTFASGKNFYRIRMDNADGSSTFTKIVEVTNGESLNRLTVYPNPTSGELHFAHNLALPDNAPVVLRIFNVAGAEVLNQTLTAGQLANESLDVSLLSAGAYQLVAQTPAGILSARFIRSH